MKQSRRTTARLPQEILKRLSQPGDTYKGPWSPRVCVGCGSAALRRPRGLRFAAKDSPTCRCTRPPQPASAGTTQRPLFRTNGVSKGGAMKHNSTDSRVPGDQAVYAPKWLRCAPHERKTRYHDLDLATTLPTHEPRKEALISHTAISVADKYAFSSTYIINSARSFAVMSTCRSPSLSSNHSAPAGL